MSHTTAQIIASYGRRFIVRCADGCCYEATARKKKVDYACGDHVRLLVINSSQAVIESVLPRHSLLYRQDAWNTKLIAANVSRLFVVLAAEPTPSPVFLQRALIAAEAAGIAAFIVLNKADLPQTASLRASLSFYEELAYPLTVLSAKESAAGLYPLLQGQTSLFIGQSGMGKSTLTNALLGREQARIGSLSAALDSGRHTTTHAQMYDLDADSFLIDSPGLQEFGLHHIAATDLIRHFPDLRPLHGHCRFHNCTHRQEPGCALKTAAEEGLIRAERLLLLQKLTDECLQGSRRR